MFEKRVLFMTGKGGVGKTTLSAALAYAARERDRRVCLVEVGRSTNLRYLFEREIPLYQEVEVDDNITAMTLDPFMALQEYTVKQIKVKKVADWVLNSQVIQYLTQAAPGWRELITIGKIWHLESQQIGYKKRAKYDMIIVDAPATGHGISFLRVPAVILDVLKFGPVRSQTNEVQRMLMDPDRTMLNVVTLPEEMSVNEAAELVKTARETLKINVGCTFVNGVYPPLFDPAEEKLFEKLEKDKAAMDVMCGQFPDKGRALFAAAGERKKRAELSAHYLKAVDERIGGPAIAIPHLYSGRMDKEAVRTIAKIINEATEEGA